MYNKKLSCLAILLVFFSIWCSKSAAISANSLTNQLPIQGIKSEVLTLAVNAYKNAKQEGIGTKDILTIVDYSMPSTSKRLWVIDMRTNKVLFNTLVAHGMGSGQNYATKFSNKHGSKMSSLGLYVTSTMYHGNHGKSLNLIGLEDKFNSNANARRIVFHRAHYVDESTIKKIGRLGRSFGCLALSNKVADKVMNSIKEGSLVFCYYPDKKWLSESKFL